MGKNDWASESNLILMSMKQLRELLPDGLDARVGYTGLQLGPFSSNLYSLRTNKPVRWPVIGVAVASALSLNYVDAPVLCWRAAGPKRTRSSTLVNGRINDDQSRIQSFYARVDL
jgi:hypothetical protein